MLFYVVLLEANQCVSTVDAACTLVHGNARHLIDTDSMNRAAGYFAPTYSVHVEHDLVEWLKFWTRGLSARIGGSGYMYVMSGNLLIGDDELLLPLTV